MMAEEHMEIEPETDLEEVSSAYDSCYSSGSDNTTTIISEVTNYRYENGRRYHSYSEGQYLFPNDEKQNVQLDIFHHVYSLVLDGDLFLAPIGSEPKKILDLGTGTGIWAIDVADRFPTAHVLGNDLSPIQPAWIPDNLSFEVDDFTKPWLHPPNTFTFIHGRALYGSVCDWPKLCNEAFQALHPGGYFESVETTTEFFSEGKALLEDSALVQWCKLTNEATERIGRPFLIMSKVRGWMKKAGFENVTEKVYKVPIGPWCKDKKLKEVGKWNLLNMLEAAEGFTLALFTRVIGWDIERTRELLEQIQVELKDKNNRLFYKMYVTYGRKPSADDSGEDDAMVMDTDDSGYQEYQGHAGPA